MNRKPKTHHVKTWPEFYKPAYFGFKPFEVRKNDRNYQVGDTFISHEWNPETKEYSGSATEFRIGFILQGGQFGIDPEYVVMATEYVCNHEGVGGHEPDRD